MLVLLFGPWFLSLILILDFGPWFWSLIFVLDFGPWFWSLILVLDFGAWCWPWFWPLVLALDFGPWFWSLILVLDFGPWFWSLMLALILVLDFDHNLICHTEFFLLLSLVNFYLRKSIREICKLKYHWAKDEKSVEFELVKHGWNRTHITLVPFYLDME